jgi:hypothetical protein
VTAAHCLPWGEPARVLERVDRLRRPQTAPHHLVLAQTRAGKSSLVKQLLRLRSSERVLIIDPKRAADPVWDDEPGEEHSWGRPVTSLGPGYGRTAEGGGPHGLWFRLVATADHEATRRGLLGALGVVADEGHVVLVIDDAREVCRAYNLAPAVESVLLLGGAASTSVVLATQEVGYVPGRAQAAFRWIGHTGDWAAAKAAAGALGRSGRAFTEAMATIPAYSWCYVDDLAGNPGPCITSFPA